MIAIKIAVDFDGTCVTHAYPEMGTDIGAVSVLKELVANGHKLILYTMRGDTFLKQAEQWFKDNGVELYASQMDPEQSDWTTSTKCYAAISIDDRNLGCPLIFPSNGERPYVNWAAIRLMLKGRNLI